MNYRRFLMWNMRVFCEICVFLYDTYAFVCDMCLFYVNCICVYDDFMCFMCRFSYFTKSDCFASTLSN